MMDVEHIFPNEEPELVQGTSEVKRFYAQRNVLLTGGAGFLGRLLIERILRSCSDVNTLFLLLRDKKGKSPDERCKALLDDVIFDRLKREKPNSVRKIVIISGDLSQIGLGLSSENRKLLKSTHIVIHAGATVRFDGKLRDAVNTNVRGTKELLSVASEMPDLKAFIHISTAYSNCVNSVIEEKFFSPPIDPDNLFTLLNALDDASLDHLTAVLLKEWPNTYAFTKAVAEDVIRRNEHDLPLCIVRPSIVMATAAEPIVGWINNFYGTTGILIGAAVGLVRTVHCDPDLVADMIPADYVINNIIVAAWDTAQGVSNKDDSSMARKIREPPIYNVVSSCENPITWGEFMKHTEKYAIQIPTTFCIWYYYLKLVKYPWLHNILTILLHLIPAAVVDTLAWLTGRKPMLWKAYQKIHKFSSVIQYFTMHQWRFGNENVQQLRQRLNPVDRNEFDLDIGKLNWVDYTYRHVRGLRVYLLKDPLETLPQGHAKYRKLMIAHYTLLTVLCALFIWLLLTILRFIGIIW